MPFAPSSFLLLVVRPGAPSSVLVPSSDASSVLACFKCMPCMLNAGSGHDWKSLWHSSGEGLRREPAVFV